MTARCIHASKLIYNYASRPRILYAVVFFWLAWTGGRFTAPFLKEEVGFDDGQIGFLLACQSGLLAIIGPLGGVIADKRQITNKHGRVEVLFAGICLGCVSTLFHGIAHIFPSFTYSIDQTSFMRQVTFLWHLSMRLLFSLSNGLVMPVLDGLTLAYLQADKNSDSADYGKERLHGAIWWAIGNIILGPMLDLIGFKALYFSCILVLMVSFPAIYMYTSSFEKKIEGNISDKPVETTTQNKTAPTSKIGSSDEGNDSILFFVKIICGTVYGASFLLCFFTLNTGTSVVENLIFLFFGDLGGSNTICGLTVIITVIFEFPIFHYAPHILRKIGAGNIQKIACLAYVTRVLGYSMIPKNHMAYVLFLEPLHGVTYAFSQTSAVEFFAKFMPPGYEARGQGIMNIFKGTGYFVGLSLGGWAEQTLGPRAMYRGFAIAVFLAMVQFTIGAKWDDWIHSKYLETGNKEESKGLLSGVVNDSSEKTIEHILV